MSSPNLSELYAGLQAERERTWSAAQLARNVDTRAELVARYNPAHHIAVGDRLPDFTLADVSGGVLTRSDLPAAGAVLIFFRFAGCPACNIALPHYQKALWPTLKARGVALIAISPQIPEKLIEIKTRHDLSYIVASDTDNRLGSALGITFEPSNPPSPPPAGWIGELTGTGTWTLPQPTVIFADVAGVVRFVDVSPDWLKRSEASAILTALNSVGESA